MADFLFEIGLEEVPARMIAGAQAELARRVETLLFEKGLLKEGYVVESFATPRRLAVRVSHVLECEPDSTDILTGPSVKIAYKDGQPTAVAVAFAKKVGIAVDSLQTISNSKGEYLKAEIQRTGKAAAEVIAAEMPKELAGIYWAKNMYWRAGRPERFVRPVRWMVAMLGGETVPVEFGGYVAGRVTYGHRVLFGEQEISLKRPGDYEDALLGGFVVADVEARRQRIRKALDKVTRTIEGLRWREDHELVDKLTQLTEWPSVLLGAFEKEYLALPEEVLVTVMRDHQNYFAVEAGSPKTGDGKLAPHFLAVLNTEADEAGVAVIRHGNERVLRARFNDARFFWEFDQRVPLVERVELLKNVTFQKDLGSYAAKTERVRELCKRLFGKIEGRGVAVDLNALLDAALLAKTDLTTELVKEFTELQGEVGGLYARAQEISPAACDAIYDQYRPVSMEDRIPRTVEGQLLAIADKADTIAGMFGLGLEPTGSKDPFALRRAANGIVKILGESLVQLGLGEISRTTVGENEELVRKIEVFFAERLEFYLREAKGQAYDVVKAVLAVGADDVRDASARAEAVTAVRGSADFAAVSSAFKRMKNILTQNLDRVPNAKAFSELKEFHPAQEHLRVAAENVLEQVSELKEQKQYKKALEAIATLRPAVDAFFGQVMVMDPDEQVRASRLNLLATIVQRFSGIADFSEIVIAG